MNDIRYIENIKRLKAREDNHREFIIKLTR